jgi:hypothetical protein
LIDEVNERQPRSELYFRLRAERRSSRGQQLITGRIGSLSAG